MKSPFQGIYGVGTPTTWRGNGINLLHISSCMGQQLWEQMVLFSPEAVVKRVDDIRRVFPQNAVDSSMPFIPAEWVYLVETSASNYTSAGIHGDMLHVLTTMNDHYVSVHGVYLKTDPEPNWTDMQNIRQRLLAQNDLNQFADSKVTVVASGVCTCSMRTLMTEGCPKMRGGVCR